MSRTRRDIVAAGGVVHRRRDDTVEFVVVHRPDYDDWSLPKGKAHKGEELSQTALREVFEETGLRCELGERLPSVAYDTPRGDHKTVHWWEMTVRQQVGREADDEVDRWEWVDLDRFAELDPFPTDLEVVHFFFTRRSGLRQT